MMGSFDRGRVRSTRSPLHYLLAAATGLLLLCFLFCLWFASKMMRGRTIENTPRDDPGSTWICEETGLSFSVSADGRDCTGFCASENGNVPFQISFRISSLIFESPGAGVSYIECGYDCKDSILRLYDIELDELYHFAYEELHFVMQEAEG